MNQKRLFNEDWEFAKSTLEVTNAESLDFHPIDLPHDWLIYNTLDLYENSIGWYRKYFINTKNDEQLLLCFDGIYMDSTIYVNHQWVGEWKYGYSSFEYEITDMLIDGENEILVKVVHQSPNSRWYSGAGIYRNVWLKTRDCNHIVTDGIYIHTVQKNDVWRVEIDTDVSITGDMRLSQTILYKDREIKTCVEKISAGDQTQATSRVSQVLTVENALLWSPGEPHLYQLKTELQHKAPDQGSDEVWTTIEEVTQCIGFRSIVLDPQEGMLLNGVKIA